MFTYCRRHSLLVLFLLLLVGPSAALSNQKAAPSPPPIEFELLTEPGFPIGGAHQWLALLAKLQQTSIRIRTAEAGDQELVENRGNERQPIFRVVGILTSRNRLRLPRGEFGLGDRERLGEWIQQLGSHGIDGPKKTTVYGLTDEQLVAFHDKLAVPISCVTKGRRAGDVARDIVKGLDMPFSVSNTARESFSSSYVLSDDLRSLATGTALAAAIRPLGLVLRPEKTSDESIRLLLCSVRETEDSWPVGWPLQDIPSKVAPKLFDYLKVTIQNRTLSDALGAIEPRVQIPFLIDHNSLARRDIDPSAVKVSFAKERAMYRMALDNLLFQAGLTSELRVDEAGRPFLWITTR